MKYPNINTIPFSLKISHNSHIKNKNSNSSMYYAILTKTHSKASDCIKCHKCEKSCPQHLKITYLLNDVANTFEKKN